jgi:DNA-binding IclR family transcriptional regulator
VSTQAFNQVEQTSGTAVRPALAPAMLVRAVEVLEAFEQREEWGVRELARERGASPSSMHHVVTALERMGMLQRTQDRRYRLGWRAGGLGVVLGQAFRPAQLANDVLETLAASTGETAHMGTLTDGEVVYLAKVEGHHAIRLSSKVGQRFPAHATACGKALLAHDRAAAAAVSARRLVSLTPHTITDPEALEVELEAIRRGGLARDCEEIELHSACAALPVLPHDGEPTRYALSVSGPRQRIEESLPALEEALHTAAAALSQRLYGTETRPAAA